MNLTRELAEEKYSKTKVKFARYYKYSFTYDGVADDGSKVTVSHGGCDDDIYRHEVSANEEIEVGEFEYWTSVLIQKNDGDCIYKEYNA